MKKLSSLTVILFVLLISFSLQGCKDVFEEDITKDIVVVNSPVNGAQSYIYNQLFWWNELEGASQYTIQIASPSFASLVTIVVDTIVTETKFYKTLAPGQYEWRIRAENGGYKTNFQTYSLTMNLSSLDLQTVNLVAPVNNKYQNTSLFNFSWETLAGATKYIIEIDTVSQNFTNPVKRDSTVEINYSYTFLKEGDYKWRVKAKDDDGNQSGWSSTYYTGYYTTAPGVPTPTSPALTATSSPTSLNFVWNSSLRADTYNLYFYSDTLLASTESYTGITTTNKTVSLIGATVGSVIWWRVSATDKAGNQSTLSKPARKITIQ